MAESQRKGKVKKWCVISTGKQVVPISEGSNWNGCYGIHFGM